MLLCKTMKVNVIFKQKTGFAKLFYREYIDFQRDICYYICIFIIRRTEYDGKRNH